MKKTLDGCIPSVSAFPKAADKARFDLELNLVMHL
ncbi:hypothetical protein SAMN05421755_107412 [Nitrosomonas sp. Nm33]|nr:hypothetical protein SAMN05421755_107412 [Nitrosomonas sp. Nm33]